MVCGLCHRIETAENVLAFMVLYADDPNGNRLIASAPTGADEWICKPCASVIVSAYLNHTGQSVMSALPAVPQSEERGEA